MENIDFFGGSSIDLINDTDLDKLFCALDNIQAWPKLRDLYNNMNKGSFIALFVVCGN